MGLAMWPDTVVAQATPVKIGFITTLSGPGGYIGEDIRDAFRLAVEQGQGRLGGVPVEVIVEDDGLKPAQAKTVVERMLKRNGVKLFSGIVFSNILAAVVPDVLDAGGFYVSPNAAPSTFAGRNCHKNFFAIAWQNDTLHETAGLAANELGYKRAAILAPNYQAGKDALTGFRRTFKGEIAAEIYTRLDQTDFASELAQIRAARPDMVFQFHPGGLGIAFIRQYAQAGLAQTVPMVVPESSLDSTILAAVGDAALGITATTHWNADFPGEANRAFVAAFQAKYNRLATVFASQSFETALAIGAALRAVDGDLSQADAFRAAMLKADFPAIRGAFSFGPNQHPVQDWWVIKVEKGADGKPVLVTRQKIATGYGDSYAATCRL
ncbi:ABC transporter substrate-binding protein [Phreatobacter stygius]|uniref:ABC transporter substrate-binding protein n=2 Tax=Phreatobacter stygius TaxID=1940610 RepID=A0A4D7BK05_9HYPH|nr:ABC transporter substrate-binding protein [Phreatobacter stygius]